LRILDAENDRPLSGSKVSVEMKGVPVVVFTDSEGIIRFIAEHSSTTIKVRAEMDGYEITTRRIPPSGNIEVQEIRLNPSRR
jgi:hypothetical protein